jgi:hypothetical protein
MIVQNSQIDPLVEVLRELQELKHGISELKHNPPIAPEWIPRSQVMQFFSYGDTQMGALEKNEDLVVARIGNRKFFHRESIAKLIEKNIVHD